MITILDDVDRKIFGLRRYNTYFKVEFLALMCKRLRQEGLQFCQERRMAEDRWNTSGERGERKPTLLPFSLGQP
jgi:hypothetical protein